MNIGIESQVGYSEAKEYSIHFSKALKIHCLSWEIQKLPSPQYATYLKRKTTSILSYIKYSYTTLGFPLIHLPTSRPNAGNPFPFPVRQHFPTLGHWPYKISLYEATAKSLGNSVCDFSPWRFITHGSTGVCIQPSLEHMTKLFNDGNSSFKKITHINLQWEGYYKRQNVIKMYRIINPFLTTGGM